MRYAKILGVILIISAGIIGSYFIIKNSKADLLNNGIKEINNNSTSGIISKNPLKWVENTVQNITNNSLNSFSNNKDDKIDNKNTINLTELVAKTIFSQMKSQDEAGNNPFQGKNFNLNDAESKKIIQEAINNIQNSKTLFNTLIEDNELKISNDNSKNAKLNYIKAIEEITRTRFNNPRYQRTSEEIINDINNDCFFAGKDSLNKDLAQLYKNLVIDYLNLVVPSDWLDLHKRIITHFKTAQLVYEAFVNCINDPMMNLIKKHKRSDYEEILF